MVLAGNGRARSVLEREVSLSTDGAVPSAPLRNVF